MGLGLNLFLSAPQAESINQPWTDIASALGAKVYQRRNELVALLLNQLLPVIAEFDTGNMAKYAGEWRTYDCMFGQPAHLYIAEHCYSGIVGGIDNDGFLLLETCEGQVRRFASGEVSFRVA
jgi:BirA family biotin operon repressor/biotin-[acetyl-CoA-carboxylase] ligase